MYTVFSDCYTKTDFGYVIKHITKMDIFFV